MPATKSAILMYHAIQEQPSLLAIRPDEFRRQVRWISDQGYAVIPIIDMVRGLAGEYELPEKCLALSFDDGFLDFYSTAFPILNEYNFPATVFLVTGYVGRENSWPGQPRDAPRLSLASWAQVEEMSRYGIDFGAHTVNHPRLDRITYATAVSEILGSKKAIEDRIQKPVGIFAYPYGISSAQVKLFVQQNFSCACGTRNGLITTASDPSELPRIEIQYLITPDVLAGVQSWWMPYYLEMRNRLHGLRRITHPQVY